MLPVNRMCFPVKRDSTLCSVCPGVDTVGLGVDSGNIGHDGVPRDIIYYIIAGKKAKILTFL